VRNPVNLHKITPSNNEFALQALFIYFLPIQQNVVGIPMRLRPKNSW